MVEDASMGRAREATDIAQDALLARASTHPHLDSDFDQVDKLTSAAHLAIATRLSSSRSQKLAPQQRSGKRPELTV
jgi:hypothetical protein